MSFRENSPSPRRKARGPGLLTAAGVGVLVLIGLIVTAIGAIPSKASGGEVIVVRNGGLLDDNSIRQIIQPNSGLTFTGLWSSDHRYPVSQRYFKVSAAEGSDSNEVIQVSTKDGVTVGVEGTFYFELSTDEAALRTFDNQFGTRTFASGDQRLYPWEGDEGWQALLDATLSNVTQTAARQALAGVSCGDLVSACKLISAGGVTPENLDTLAAGGNTDSTITTVQQQIADAFRSEANSVLGDGVLVNVTFSLSRIVLPENVQNSINSALSTLTDANAKLANSKAEAEANKTRQDGYNACPACAQIDIVKSIPGGITVWAPGGDAAVAVAPSQQQAPAAG